MATGNVVPKHVDGITLIKCCRCGSLYSTDQPRKIVREISRSCYEPCPVCGSVVNDTEDEIPLWRYNLIKWWREKIAR